MTTGKVLVIDDDPTITVLLNTKLSERGYEVKTAGDGEEGLRLAKSFAPDLIILDILMPEMDGYSFVLAFKKFGDIRNTPIIVLTSQDSFQNIFEIEGVNDYVLKPFDLEHLLQKIHRRLTSKSKKVLVVDDEPDVVDIIKTRLNINGYDVITAYDGLEGLEKAKQERPDLMVLDVMMPKLDGYNVCRMLKFDNRYKDIAVVILTALANDEMLETGHEVGADVCLSKPYDGNMLLEKMKQLLWD